LPNKGACRWQGIYKVNCGFICQLAGRNCTSGQLCCADAAVGNGGAGNGASAEQNFGAGDGCVRNQRDGITQKICDSNLFGFTGADIRDRQQIIGCKVNASKCG
jgi:hypothetical protein